VVFRPDFQACRYIEESLPMFGALMNRLSDWLWSMYGARAAAMSISARCGSSHAVRYRSLRSSGRPATACTEPSARLIASRTGAVHIPSCWSSVTSAVLIWRNSPESVSRLNRLETCGSTHS
jgi:hypothetical protein